MTSSVSEAKITIEEKVGETEATVPATEESKSTSTASEPSKKKKKKKKDPSTAAGSGENNEDDMKKDTSEKDSTNTEKTAPEGASGQETKAAPNDPSVGPVVSSSKRTRPPYKYDPEKVTLRFLFANRDGLTVTVECKPSDTIGEIKGQLLSVWPEDLQSCTSGDQLRLICMGKGMLSPDTRTLKDCDVPVFKTHPTPVNIAVRPKTTTVDYGRGGKDSGARGGASSAGSHHRTTEQSGQGCGCVIS